MTTLFKKILLFFSLILFFLARFDKVFGQGSSHDSIDYFLNHITENTKDQAILKAVGEARNEYCRQVGTSTAIDVYVAKTLLNVDSILVISSKFDRSTTLTFA